MSKNNMRDTISLSQFLGDFLFQHKSQPVYHAPETVTSIWNVDGLGFIFGETMSSGVYKIQNNINGKIYVGSAINLISRWRSHISKLNRGKHHSRHLQFSWNVYGNDSFSFLVIEYCEKDKLIEREQYYLDTLQPEYNTLPNAGSTLGTKLSTEHRAKISKSLTGNKHTLGHKLSLEHIEKIIAANKNPSPETRVKKSIASKKKRRPLTQEHKDKLSVAHTGIKQKFRSDEHRKNLSDALSIWWKKRKESK